MATYKLAKTDEVRPVLPPQTFFVPSLKEVLSVGEYVELIDPFPSRVLGRNIEALLSGGIRYGQILSYDHGRQQFEIRAFARVPSSGAFTPEYIDCDKELTPPLSRPYIQYPDELLATNFVWPFMPIDRIRCEIFVFSQDDLDFSNLGNPYGMRNAFILRHEYDQNYQTVYPTEDIFPFHLHPFPCYTARTWYFLVSIKNAIHGALNQGPLNQRTTARAKVHLVYAQQWELICDRVSPDVEKEIRKPGTSTKVVNQGLGTRETIKYGTSKERLVFDTEDKVLKLRQLLGDDILLGYRFRPARGATKKPRGGEFVVSAQRLQEHDAVNAFAAWNTVEGTKQGIIFEYDGTVLSLTVILNFRKFLGGDHPVRGVLGIEQDANLEPSENDVIMKAGTTRFQRDKVRYLVHTVASDQVQCHVVTSENENVKVGDSISFARGEAQSLVNDYYNCIFR